MGIAYLYGKGTTKDVGEAQRWFAKAMAQGHPFAFLHAGAIAERGLAGEVSIPQAVALYEQASALGATGGLVRIGNISRRADNLDEAARHYQRAADLGDTEAMIILAKLKIEGHLAEGPNLISAAGLYRDAANAKDRDAAYALAKGLLSGELPKHSVPEPAETFLLQAANQGHAEALVAYAQVAQKQQDLVLAEEFLARAKDLGHEQAAALLKQLR